MADGKITISTEADKTGVKVGMKEIEASVKRMSVTVGNMGEKVQIAVQKQLDSLSKLNNQYGQQEQKVQGLKDKLKELSQQKVESEEYKKLGKDIDSLYGKAAKLEADLKEWSDIGVPENSDTFKKTEAELEKICEDIEKLEKMQNDMKSSGTAYSDPKSSAQYQETVKKLAAENQKMEDMASRLKTSIASMQLRLKECGEEALKSSSKFSKLADTAARFSQSLMKSGIVGMKRKLHEFGRLLDNLMKKFMQLASGAIVGGLKKISGGIFAIHKSANKSTLSLKNLLKYAFGIRTLFVLFNKLRGAISEGIQNLAKYDLATHTGTVNQSLSELQGALTRLKNSFATAFAPILTVAAPILVQFINLISQAVTRVGMLIAALTGQQTFVKAIAVQKNYAASLDNAANSAKKAAKALQGYLSPIDEINRYDDGSSSDSGIGSGGKYTGPSAGDMFEEVPIESSLKGIADKIKELIKNEDWEGLGAYMADGINKGLRKVYDVISWNNVGPKVTEFITAFTATFNSLADHIDWDLMGRTLGTGINTAINTLNLLIGNGGIDFNKIGSSIAKALRGAIREIDWKSLGQLLGNKFMISWKLLSGFVQEMARKSNAGITGWTELGKSIGKAMTGMFEKISFKDVANAIVGVINGAFEILAGFDAEFDWDAFRENLKEGIETAINGIEWKKNGKAFGDFLSNLCGTLRGALTKDTFYDFGQGIGEFLGELPWGEILKTAADLLLGGFTSALNGLFDGLEKKHPIAGHIAEWLTKAFLAVKIANITGISSLVKLIIGKIAARMMAAESTAVISDSVGNMLNTALSGAANGAKDLATSLGPLVGTAGLIIGVGAAATVATSELAGFVETMQGGNGVGSTFGNTMNNFIQTLQRRGDILSGSAEEIWQLKESLEQEGMTAEDKASATQKLIDKLGEMGVTSDQAEQAFSTLYQQGLITDDMFDILSESIKTLGDNTTNMAGSIDLSKQSIDDLYDNVLPQLQTQLGLSADQVTALDTALLETEDSGGTAQDAFNRIMERAEELGINTESVAKIFAEVFPDAVRETESSTKTSMDNTKTSVETGMGAASAAAGAAMAGIQKSTEDAMSAANKSVTDNSKDIATASKDNWEDSASSVSTALGTMDTDTKDIMSKVMTTIQSYWSSVLINTNQIWEGVTKKIEKELGNALTAAKRISSEIIGTMNGVISKVNGSIGDINNSIRGIERGFTFSYNVQLPNGGRRWGNYHLNLPTVNTVPYLATGAVIPPRSEFLAVLGDQKNGRNLEAPEGLIRQIFREESGSKQGNNTYNVSVSASGRNLLDIILEEGELRRNRNGGRNPFKLDE